ncbi:hypothetical protein ACJX0J_037576, partial [Zea mays]
DEVHEGELKTKKGPIGVVFYYIFNIDIFEVELLNSEVNKVELPTSLAFGGPKIYATRRIIGETTLTETAGSIQKHKLYLSSEEGCKYYGGLGWRCTATVHFGVWFSFGSS